MKLLVSTGLGAAVLMTLLASGSAQATTIDFEASGVCSGCGFSTTSYRSGGYSVTGSFTLIGVNNGPYGKAIRMPFGSQVIIDKDVGLFGLESVDLAEYSTVFAGTRQEITFLGYRADETVVSQTFTIDGYISGTDRPYLLLDI